MDEVVICEPVRTAVGRFGGVLKDVHAAELAATVIRALIERSHIDPGLVEDVILGQCYPNGEAPAIGRVAALDAGLSVEVPGTQVDRRCGSGLQAIIYAVMQVQTGAAKLIIAGGVESMSQVEFYSSEIRGGARQDSLTLIDRLARARVTAGGVNHPVPGGMLETAENLRRMYSISREEQDVLAYTSHQRASLAQETRRFADEIVPVNTRLGREMVVVERDEHPRKDTTVAKLATLRPLLLTSDPAATVTAGNASGQNDAAAGCIVTTRRQADSLGLEPFARLVSWSVKGVSPEVMGLGPVPATATALARAGLTLADIDLIELNEAFAAQVLAVTREWSLAPADFDRVNVNGSGISLGHPLGASGARILATLLHEMRRRDSRYGLETMCIGGGQGLAAIFERA